MADFFVHESSYIDNSVEIGENTKIWHFCHIQSGAKIGKNCSLGQNVNISNNVIIGNDVKIQNNVSVYEGVEIEDGVTPRARYPKGHENYKHTLIKEGASIGANATIICGNTVGRYAMIAAGAVVTKDIPDYALAVGVPAQVVGTVDKQGNIVYV